MQAGKEKHRRGWRRRQGTRLSIEFFAVAAPVICFTAEFRAAGEESPMPPVLYQMVTMLAIEGVQMARDGLRAAFTAEAPLQYLRNAGKGNARRGLVTLGLINVVSLGLPITCALAYGGLMGGLTVRAESAGNGSMQLALNVLDAPVIHTLILGAMGFPLYHLTKSGLHHKLSIKKSHSLAGDDLSVKRRLMHTATFRLLDDVLLAELFRQSLLTFGPAVALHYPLFSLVPVVLDQWLLTPLRDFHVETKAAEVVSCRHPAAAFRYAIRSAMVVAAMVGLNYLALGVIADDNDPESIDQPWHIAYEVGLMTAALLLEQGLSLLPPFREASGTWYRKLGLFGGESSAMLPLDGMLDDVESRPLLTN